MIRNVRRPRRPLAQLPGGPATACTMVRASIEELCTPPPSGRAGGGPPRKERSVCRFDYLRIVERDAVSSTSPAEWTSAHRFTRRKSPPTAHVREPEPRFPKRFATRGGRTASWRRGPRCRRGAAATFRVARQAASIEDPDPHATRCIPAVVDALCPPPISPRPCGPHCHDGRASGCGAQRCARLPDPDGAWVHAYLHRKEGTRATRVLVPRASIRCAGSPPMRRGRDLRGVLVAKPAGLKARPTTDVGRGSSPRRNSGQSPRTASNTAPIHFGDRRMALAVVPKVLNTADRRRRPGRKTMPASCFAVEISPVCAQSGRRAIAGGSPRVAAEEGLPPQSSRVACSFEGTAVEIPAAPGHSLRRGRSRGRLERAISSTRAPGPRPRSSSRSTRSPRTSDAHDVEQHVGGECATTLIRRARSASGSVWPTRVGAASVSRAACTRRLRRSRAKDVRTFIRCPGEPLFSRSGRPARIAILLGAGSVEPRSPSRPPTSFLLSKTAALRAWPDHSQTLHTTFHSIPSCGVRLAPDLSPAHHRAHLAPFCCIRAPWPNDLGDSMLNCASGVERAGAVPPSGASARFSIPGRDGFFRAPLGLSIIATPTCRDRDVLSPPTPRSSVLPAVLVGAPAPYQSRRPRPLAVAGLAYGFAPTDGAVRARAVLSVRVPFRCRATSTCRTRAGGILPVRGLVVLPARLRLHFFYLPPGGLCALVRIDGSGLDFGV